MGMDLTNDQGSYFRFGMSAWGIALELADQHGWEPEKEQPYYLVNDHQQVSADDAANIADAIDNALEHVSDEGGVMTIMYTPEQYQRFYDGGEISDEEAEEHVSRHLQTMINAEANEAEVHPEELPAEEYWAGTEPKNYLRAFVKFCREGSFVID
jgi:hypothetical protein